VDILFKTVHGSRLYGLNHEDSDYDYYTVVGKVKTAKAKYSTHKIVDEVDSVVVDFGTWINLCTSGVPQALEAMFAQPPHVVYDDISSFREGWTLGTQVFDKYLRTVKSFAYGGTEKKRRHALRLAINLNDLARTGRFNPTLSPVDVEWIKTMASALDEDDLYRLALDTAWGPGLT